MLNPKSMTQAVLRFAFMLVFWLACEVLVFLPLYLFGLCTFWAAWKWARKTIRPSKLYPEFGIIAFESRWLDEVLGNHEDGLLPQAWRLKGGTAFGWFVRNPVCNMRFWPVVSTLPQPERIGFVGTVDEIPDDGVPGWCFCWQGPYAGFRWQNERRGVWIGWKTNPRDRKPGAPHDYRWQGLGLACQYIRMDAQ